jgi:hypothetical protein
MFDLELYKKITAPSILGAVYRFQTDISLPAETSESYRLRFRLWTQLCQLAAQLLDDCQVSAFVA